MHADILSRIDRDVLPKRLEAPVAHPPRHDLYRVIHKALRAILADTLVRVGRIDVDDTTDLEPALEQLTQALDFLVDHLRHEDDFVHPAIESRRPGGSERAHEEHADHLEAVARLRRDGDALRTAPARERFGHAHRLYLDLARLIAETFEHLQHEESTLSPLLWTLYSDAELGAIHDRLIATMSPPDVLFALRWTLPAISPAERAELVASMKTAMPPEALTSVLALVREHLDGPGCSKLARAVGVTVGHAEPV